MKKFFFIAITALVFFSCSNNRPDNRLFNPENLRVQHFIINPKTDTTLFGIRGGLFSIEKGSFEGDGNIDIEIKEAYSPSEIVYAGLTTESDGRLLESGGMIYFNAKRNGKMVSLLKSVGISIPTNYVNKEMKLFKGEEKADGSINWKHPEPIDSTINMSPIDTGKILFESKCVSCHNLFKDGTGPSLAFLEERVNDRAVLKAFIRNPSATMSENIYFQCQKAKYGSMMTSFANLSDREIELILSYIKNESDKRLDLKISNTPMTQAKNDTGYYHCIAAPCGFDTIYVDTTKYEYVRGNMMDLHQEAHKEDSMDYLYKNPDSLENAMRTNGFVDILPT